MKKNNLLILGLVGLGLYLYYRNKNNSVYTNTMAPASVDPNNPVNSTGIQELDFAGTPITQTLDVRGNAFDNQVRARFSLSGYKKLGQIPNTI
jgi:hypothetical protein